MPKNVPAPMAYAVRVALVLVAAHGCVPGELAAQSFDPDRLMANVRTYYDFGVHRTGYEGDIGTSRWLTDRFRTLGLETEAHRFRTPQFFLDEASIEDDMGPISAFPIWLPRATPAGGIRARLVRVRQDTPDAEIRGAIAWLDPTRPSERGVLDEKAIEAGAAAIVFESTDRDGRGLFQAINVERRYVGRQRPVPTLIFGGADRERLTHAVGRQITVTLTGRLVQDTEAESVIGKRVVDEDADWIVVSTPSSGWFQNAGERGPGIAMLLALAEWVSRRTPRLNYYFVANSGHELDYLGARLLHDAHVAPEPAETRAWIHLGAQIATPPWHEVDGAYVPTDSVTTGTLQATEHLAPILARAFEDMPAFTLRTDTRIGEFRDLLDAGYRGLGIVGGSNPWFHVPGDDPRGVSGETLAKVTAAFAHALEDVERAGPGSR